MSTPEQKRSVAIHEAAHLVMHRHFGGEARARIFQEEFRSPGGSVVSWWNGECWPLTEPSRIARFFIGLAGIAAEYMHALDNDEQAIERLVNDELEISASDLKLMGRHKLSYKNVRLLVCFLRQEWSAVLLEADALTAKADEEQAA